MNLMQRLLRHATRPAAPVDHGDVAGFVVHERATGQLVHQEAIDSGRYSSTRLADLMVAKRSRLERKYAPSRYDVEHGLFNSRDAFHHFFPDTKGK